METYYSDFASGSRISVSLPINGIFRKDDKQYQLLNNVRTLVDSEPVEEDCCNAIISYSTGAGSWTLNYALRNGWLSEFTATNVSQINNAIERYGKSKPNTLSFRGMKKLKGFDIGHVFADLAYTTKTLNLSLASRYARPNYGGSDKDEYCILFIKSSNAKMLYIGNRFNNDKDTYELISFPGEVFKILDKGTVRIKNETKEVYYVEVIGNIYANMDDLYTYYQEIETEFDEIKDRLLNLNDDDAIIFIKDRKDKDDRLNNIYCHYKHITDPTEFEEKINSLSITTNVTGIDKPFVSGKFYTTDTESDYYSELGYYAGQDYYSGDTKEIIYIKNFAKYFYAFISDVNVNYIVSRDGAVEIKTNNKTLIEDYLYGDILKIDRYDLGKEVIWSRRKYGFVELKWQQKY